MADALGMLSDLADKAPGLLNWFLKKIYKEEELKNRITVDLSSNKSTICAQLLDNADISVILRIANFTPFELTVENITLEFRWDGVSKKIHKNNFEKISKCSEKNVFLRESLSSEEVMRIAIASDKKMNEPRLAYTIDFSNRLYRFQKYGELDSFELELINKDIALQKLKKAS